MEVNILGVKYKIIEVPGNDTFDGLCDTSIKQIKIVEYAPSDEPHVKGDLKYVRQKTIRHEIVHAFLYESGFDSNVPDSDEMLVDWIAIQAPKLFEAFAEAEAL